MTTTQQNRELIDNVEQFYRDYYRDEIGQLAGKYPNGQQSLEVSWFDVYRYDPDLADDLRTGPSQIIEYFNEALQQFDLPVDIDLSGSDGDPAATVTITGLSEPHTHDVGAYRSNHIGQLIGVSGQVQKKTNVQPKPEMTAYECQRCGTLTNIPQSDGQLQEPHECSGCERQGPFNLNAEQSQWVDHQLIRVALPPEKSKGGDGATIDAHLEGDLTNSVEAGDRVTVSGIMSVEEPSDGDIAFQPWLDGRGVSVDETDYQDINVDEHIEEIEALANGEYGDPYELGIGSIAPKIIGMDHIKLAVLLQMFRGNRVEYPDGSFDRGDIHVMLLGDPGTAKSKILKDAEQKAPRSTFASGKNATAAGMTAAAVRDDWGSQEWTLEAGALVLADQGLACVDEIDKVNDDAVASMHEALSNQQVHVSKAGINAHLPTRTSLLAAGNPKYGRFDEDRAIAEQIELGPTILSRFDLMFMVTDEPSREDDDPVIEGMIENRQAAARYTKNPHDMDSGQLDDIEPAVDADVLRAWIAHARQTVTPTIENDDVAAKLKESFADLRLVNGTDGDSPVPVTFRKLEGIMRLAEASAKLRLSQTIDMEDIERARKLVGRAMRDVGMDPDSGKMDADVVETGNSKSQQERIGWLEELIRTKYLEYDQGIPLSEIEAKAEENGVADSSKVRYDIEKLKKKGAIYEPQDDDCYKPT